MSVDVPRSFLRASCGFALRAAGTLLLGLLLLSCHAPFGSPRPEALPARFEHVRNGKTTPMVPVDLDGDGTDEVLKWQSQRAPSSRGRSNTLLIETSAKTVIDQVNYAHPIRRPKAVDVTGDGTKEIFVPLVRNDSLFLSVVTAEGQKRNLLYITTGTPRQEPDGTLPWDPKVRNVFWTDTNGDGTKELLTLVQTLYARLPRGVFIHEWPSGRLLGKKIVGATLDHYRLGNFDDDRDRELLVAAGAPNNGAKAGGMSDRNAYFYAFDLGPPPSVQWKRTVGSSYVKTGLGVGDLDGNGRREYVTFERSTRGEIRPTTFRLIDPGTGEIRRERTYPFSVMSSPNGLTADVDSDGRDELLVLDRSGTLHVLGATLGEEDRVHFGSRAESIERIPDVTGDGAVDILLHRGDQTLVLGPNLHIRAAVPVTGTWRHVQQGPTSRPLLHVRHSEGASVYRVVPNRWYWLYRWGPWALGLLALGLLLGGGYGAWTKYREHRRLQVLHENTTATLKTPLLLCRDDDLRGTPLNPPARRWLQQRKSSPEDAFPDNLSSGTERAPAPHPNGEAGDPADLPSSLVSWLKSLDGRAGHVYETEFPKNGNRPSTRVYARSVSIPSLAGPNETCWLLRLIPPDLQADLDTRRTWRLMAQRVAHDLRNPLTSIRLALQSMQMDYREADPEIAATLDAYVEQIDDQIESLRRTATNVMKLVGAEEQNVLETDLSSFLKRNGQRLDANLPDDVELRWELADDLPPVAIDREQMTSVLENLVYNAVEALPDGGTITIQTQLARNLSFSTSEMPRDYVLVDVMDTGVGMDAATRARAFDPGFTTAGEGTGLGLAMVKQIVEAHDGQVELESEPDVGTDVRVYLPIARGA